ncbi:MAG TPA: extracellular solute-binding protein, partial [Ktedonobacteraceae bacterium]
MCRRMYTRRQAVQIGLSSIGSLALLDLAACGNIAASNTGHDTLQMSFWGNASRNKLTKNAIQAFHQIHPNITINTWYEDFTVYFDKLNTQIASGSAPDLIQMDMSYLAQYDKQHLLLDLTPYINDKTIDLTNFDKNMMTSSEDKGTPYGISLGGNYECMLYDSNVIQQANVGALPTTMTWQEFGTYTGELSKALASKKVYGTADASGYMDLFEIWIRQQGKELWTTDGKVNYTVDDVAAWFNYWNGLRASGACVPAETQAAVTGSGASASLLTKGKAVFDTTHSNQFVGFQTLVQHTLNFQQVPTGPKPGLYQKPSMLLSVAASSKYAKDGATFINFLINNTAGVRAIGLDRGVPGSTTSQAALQPTLSASDKKVVAYGSLVASSGQVNPKTVLDPPGASKILKALTNVAQQVSFGKMSATAGAQSFI